MAQEAFDVQRDLKGEMFPGTKMARQVVCLACCEMIFSLPENPTEAERKAETVRLSAHLEFRHDMITQRFKCDDLTCQIIHVHAFHKLDRRKK